MVLQASVDLRYQGQFVEVEVPLAGDAFTPPVLDAMVAEFHRRHEAVNGYQLPAHGLELIALRVVAIGQTEKPALPLLASDAEGAAAVPSHEREIYWENAAASVPVYDGLALPPHAVVAGPAIVEQQTTTVLVPPEFDLLTDAQGNGLLYRKGLDRDAALARARGEAR
jgi:N-methylhydantoinase A